MHDFRSDDVGSPASRCCVVWHPSFARFATCARCAAGASLAAISTAGTRSPDIAGAASCLTDARFARADLTASARRTGGRAVGKSANGQWAQQTDKSSKNRKLLHGITPDGTKLKRNEQRCFRGVNSSRPKVVPVGDYGSCQSGPVSIRGDVCMTQPEFARAGSASGLHGTSRHRAAHSVYELKFALLCPRDHIGKVASLRSFPGSSLSSRASLNNRFLLIRFSIRSSVCPLLTMELLSCNSSHAQTSWRPTGQFLPAASCLSSGVGEATFA